MHNTPLLDAIIIGAGSAGLAALREVRKQTEQFLIINDGPYGTTCARVGCMPSKVLIEAANAYHRRHTFDEFGITGSSALAADIPAVLRRVRRLRDDFVGAHGCSAAHRCKSTARPTTPKASSWRRARSPCCPRPCRHWARVCSPPTRCLNKPRWARAWP